MSTDAAADPVVESGSLRPPVFPLGPTVGIVVDEVREVVALDGESGERPPDTPGQVDRIDAAAKVEGRLPGVHHVETLFGDEVAGS